MPQTFVLPRQVALDDDASPMAGALLYFFQTGTTTPQAAYSDITLTTPHAHPIVADSSGKWPKVYLDPNAEANYRVRITTAEGAQLYQEDDIDPASVSSAEIGNALYPITEEEDAAGIEPVTFLKQPGDLDRYESVYNLADVGPVIVRSKTEEALEYVNDDSFIDVTGDLKGEGTITVEAGSYGTGHSAGDIVGHYYFRLDGDGRIAFGLKFDGNGQGDYVAYQPSAVNVYFYPLILKTGSAGQKVIGSHIVDACGHAVEGAPAENTIIALNTGDHQNGVGVTNTVGFISLGNAFADGSDSHYFLNSVRAAVHVGNVGLRGVNGGGVDLVGSRETVAVGNVYCDNLAEGIWVLRSPNTGQTYRNVLTAGNVLRNNRNYGDLNKAEITTGHQDELATAQGENAAHIGNLIDVRLSASSTLNWAFWNHPLADKTFHVANVTVGETNTTDAPTAVDEGAPRSHYAFNVACPDDDGSLSQRGYLYYAAAPASRAVYAYNVNWRIHPDSVGLPTEMESGDGFWQYHIVRELPQSGIRLVEVLYEGGYTHDIIEVTVASRGDSGLTKRTFVVRGATAQTATVLDDNLDKEFGTAPPAITISAPTNEGKVVISAAADASAPDEQLTAIYIKVISAEDYPERFVPVFAA